MSITDLAEPELDRDVHAPVRLWRLTALALVLGTFAAFIDFTLAELIYLFTNLCYGHTLSFASRNPADYRFGLWAVLLPAGGGLLVGLAEKFGSRSLRGGGMAAARQAALVRGGRIPAKLALLKPLVTAVSIGSGSPLGREGPTIQSSGAFGTLLSSVFGLTEPERRLFIGCATAGGMAATYRTPVSAVLLAVEIVLLEIRSRVFVPLIVSAVTAAGLSYWLAGPGMLVRVPHIQDYGIPGALPWYALFGIACGVLGAGAAYCVDASQWFFKRISPATVWRPAIGGLAVGALGLLMPRILGTGYSTDGEIFYGVLGVGTLLLIAPLKLLAFGAAIGSGISGGLVSPLLMTGASFGALFAAGVNTVTPGAHLNPAAFALAGAGAVFGSASRAPLTFTVLTFELVLSNRALLPLTLVNIVATGVAFLLLNPPLLARRRVARNQ